MSPRSKVPDTNSEFQGIPEQAFRFLRQLKRNNDRDWFRDRKADYIRYVEEPMKQLVLSVAAACRARGLELHTKEKNPVMRVYRDIRFSKDKSPFKTHVAAELRRSFTDSECLLYLHVSPQMCFLGAGVWQTDKGLLQAWREAMIRNPARFEKMHLALQRAKLALSKEHALSGMPRGMQNYEHEPVGPWLKLTSFVVSRQLSVEDCLSSDLLMKVVDFALAAKPLFEFAWEIEAGITPLARKRVQESALV
jgi:uncharacterized protein (TIGR02453 family)